MPHTKTAVLHNSKKPQLEDIAHTDELYHCMTLLHWTNISETNYFMVIGLVIILMKTLTYLIPYSSLEQSMICLTLN
jgi:hypothetical protein